MFNTKPSWQLDTADFRDSVRRDGNIYAGRLKRLVGRQKSDMIP